MAKLPFITVLLETLVSIISSNDKLYELFLEMAS